MARPASRPWFWRTAAGAEIDLLLDRGSPRIAVEVKSGGGGDARAVRTLREALTDANAKRTWIVDHATGIEPIDEVRDGTP